MSKSDTFVGTLFGMTVAVTLISSSAMISPTLVSLFLFVLFVTATSIFAGVLLILNKDRPVLNLNLHSVLFLLWGLYIVLYPILTRGVNANLKDGYLLSCIIYYFSLIILLVHLKPRLEVIYLPLLLMGTIEALICILQYSGYINSVNSFFKVTGTIVNPNTTAMFLVLCFSAGMHILSIFSVRAEKTKSQRSRKSDRLNEPKDSNRMKTTKSLFVLVGLVLIIVAIVLLKCRTAFIGVIAIIVVIWGSRFRFTRWNNVRRRLRLLIPVLVLIFLLPILLFLYKAKEDSSRGRLLVWKVSTQMIQESPWTGYGYGLFERNYNLAQAKYFNSGKATEEEIERADHITLAYNEVIESTVEGGVIGTTLFLGFIGLLIYKCLRQFRNIHNSTSSFIKSSEKGEAIRNQVSLNAPAFAGVIAFTLMSLVNFTVQAVPVMCVFIIFSSLISAQDITVFQDKALTDKNQFLKAKEQLINVRHSNKYQNQIVALILLVSVFAIELPFIKTGFAQYHLGKSVKTISTGNPANIERTIETMKDLRPELSSCEGYYRYTAFAFFKLHDLQSAIEYYSEASKLTSNPDLFLSRGVCYEKIGLYSAAEADYLTASYIVPNRIIPKYRLMLLYLQRSNSKEASAMARQIVEMQPKVNNSQAEAAKKAAQEVLRKHNSRNNQVPFNTMQ